MSEPAIKAAGYQCQKCRHMAYENMRGGPWMHCILCDVDTVPLYTRDDLVRAVALTVATTMGLSREKSMEIAVDAVDRLTKGDV